MKFIVNDDPIIKEDDINVDAYNTNDKLKHPDVSIIGQEQKNKEKAEFENKTSCFSSMCSVFGNVISLLGAIIALIV